jgi:hypothetical protein
MTSGVRNETAQDILSQFELHIKAVCTFKEEKVKLSL